MDELTGRTKGTTYDQNLANERKKDEDASTGAKVAGTVLGAAVPGLGVLKAAQAPATASRALRALYGAGTGAIEGAASGLGHDDSDNLVDKVKSAGVGAGVGAALGGPLAAVMPATMSQKVASYIKNNGGEEGARRVAEATKDLTGLASREAQGGKAIGAKQANAVGNGYVAQAMDHIADPEIRTALQRGQALSDAQLAKLPPDIAAIINKQTTVGAQTAAKPAYDNIFAKAGRAAARNLIPIEAVRNLAVNALGGRETREQAIQKLIKQGPVADKVLEQLGPSKGAQALKVLQAKSAAAEAQRASQAGFGSAASQEAQQAAQAAAEKESADITKGIFKAGKDRAATVRDTEAFKATRRQQMAQEAAKALDKEGTGIGNDLFKAGQARAATQRDTAAFIAKGRQGIAQDAAKADAKSAADAAKAEAEKMQSMADLKAKDPTNVLGLGNPLGAPRNPAEMKEFSSTLRHQMENSPQTQAARATQAADEQANAVALAQKAQASRNAMSKATRMPLGGGYQQLLQGGASGLNLTSKEANQGLRALSNHPVLGPHAEELRRTGLIGDESAFYGVQNGLRGMKEQGYIGKQMQGPQGALSSATEAVRNPIAYKEAVRQAGSALDRAVSKAPTDELAGFASQVANLRTTAAKEALVQSRLQSATPTEAKFIKELVHPLTKYGPKK
jgi:hypothetical protein